MCQGCLKCFLLVFEESFHGVLSKIDECIEGDLKVFQGSFKGISKKFQVVFRECLKKV